jgi:hypothetical protein
LDFKHVATFAAVEVVMVRFARALVARRLAGDIDGNEPALLDKRLDCAIDGGDAEARGAAAGGAVGFLRAEGPAGFLKASAKGGALGGLSLRSHFGRAGLRTQQVSSSRPIIILLINDNRLSFNE